MTTVTRLVNRFRDTGTLHRVASNMEKEWKRVTVYITEHGGRFLHLI
jgi:hypothetical protein